MLLLKFSIVVCMFQVSLWVATFTDVTSSDSFCRKWVYSHHSSITIGSDVWESICPILLGLWQDTCWVQGHSSSVPVLKLAIFHLCHFVGSPSTRLRVSWAQRSNPFQRTLTRPCMLPSTILSRMMMTMWRRQPMVLKAKIWICVYKIAHKLGAYDFFVTWKEHMKIPYQGPSLFFCHDLMFLHYDFLDVRTSVSFVDYIVLPLIYKLKHYWTKRSSRWTVCFLS